MGWPRVVLQKVVGRVGGARATAGGCVSTILVTSGSWDDVDCGLAAECGGFPAGFWHSV